MVKINLKHSPTVCCIAQMYPQLLCYNVFDFDIRSAANTIELRKLSEIESSVWIRVCNVLLSLRVNLLGVFSTNSSSA